MTVSPAKTAEPIEMPFEKWTQLEPENYVLDGIRISTREGPIFWAKRPGHVRRSMLKANQRWTSVGVCAK